MNFIIVGYRNFADNLQIPESSLKTSGFQMFSRTGCLTNNRSFDVDADADHILDSGIFIWNSYQCVIGTTVL